MIKNDLEIINFASNVQNVLLIFLKKEGELNIYKNDHENCGIFKPEQLHKPLVIILSFSIKSL